MKVRRAIMWSSRYALYSSAVGPDYRRNARPVSAELNDVDVLSSADAGGELLRQLALVKREGLRERVAAKSRRGAARGVAVAFQKTQQGILRRIPGVG